jgi:SAM-dependent methyltransferase
MNTSWEKFFREKTQKLFKEKRLVIDIGGGLRVIKEKSNRYDRSREWLRPYIEKVDYKTMDLVDTYHPDIVGDIQAMPFDDNSIDAVICLSILTHVENPIQAYKEMYRVLKPGGYALIYVPFLYYYHAEKGYYGDFWRFTEDSLRWLSKPFTTCEIVRVRGAVATWFKLSPLGRYSIFEKFGNALDKLSGKSNSKQTSGYYVFLEK